MTTAAGLGLVVDHAERQELVEGGLDTVAAHMAVEKAVDLFSGQTDGGCFDGGLDAIGGEVSGGGAEEQRGTGAAVVPYGESGLEVGQGDKGAAIERSVDGAETQDLGFGAVGSGSEETDMGLAQGWVPLIP